MAYSGQVATIQLGSIGLLTDLPPGQLPPGSLLRANNVSFETGLITKAPGSAQYNTVALPASVVAIKDWWPNPSTQRMIAACSNGSVYRDIGDRNFSANVAIASGLGNLTPKCFFVDGGQETAGRVKKLFLLTGTAQMKVLRDDGVAFSTITSPAADWVTPNYPTVGLIHRNRLWAFLGQRAYASDSGDHENFLTNILTDNIFPGEGGVILGAYVFKGRLFAFKEGGFVYYLDDQDPTSTNWVWRKLASNFGLASPHGIIEIGDDMIAVNESGSPISYNAVNALGDIESADTLRLMQIEEYFRNSTSQAGLDQMHAVYYAAKKQAFFTWRDSFRQTNNLLFHIDTNKTNPRPAFWPKDSAECLGLRKDMQKVLRPFYGSSDGFIYLMDQENRLTGPSTAYNGEFKIAHTDFSFMDGRAGTPPIAQKNKNFDYLSVEFLPQGDWNISVDVFIDGRFSETISYSMDITDDGLDKFTLGSGAGGGLTTPTGGDGDPLQNEETQTVLKPLHGSGRRIGFAVRQSGSNQNYSIASLTVGFRVSAEQATRI